MKRIIGLFVALFMTFCLGGCGLFTVVEEGKTGVRVTATGTVVDGELAGGDWYWTVFSKVLEFQTRDISLAINDKRYTTQEDVPLEDFDMSLTYVVNPATVSETYKTRDRSWNMKNGDGDILLLYSRIETLANGVAYKEVRRYKQLEAADKRADLEAAILRGVNEAMAADGLGNIAKVTTMTIRSIMPNKEILASSAAVVKSANDLRVKNNEVDIAKKEAERMAALSANSNQSIAYMNAQATLNFSQAALNGKVSTMLIPHGMNILPAGMK